MLTLDTERLCQVPWQPSQDQSRKVYWGLFQENPDAAALAEAHAFLQHHLQAVQAQPCPLPADMALLPAWVADNSARVGEQYQRYLAARKAGAARHYFRSKSHALYFLKGVAPTKMVDGAWLYGILEHWDDSRCAALINIYLEELGEGIPDKNHVAIYRRLLAAHGCDQWQQLAPEHFVQGALQLSLGHLGARFLPEVIGFNLGYEQLPLHLLITAYELNELGIDPYYFTLHVTVDNAGSGHAVQALQALWDALPAVTEQQDFYRRVRQGYKLSLAGKGSLGVIDGFDLRQETLAMLREKAAVGACLHSDYCRIGGKTVNEWLAQPDSLPGFLDALEESGWIQRHQDPANSRFWRLIEGEGARMFGVFTPYERQLIHDWIAGEAAGSGRLRPLSYRARQQLLRQFEPRAEMASAGGEPRHPSRGVFRNHSKEADEAGGDMHDFNRDLRLLEEQLAGLPGQRARMRHLVHLMSPVHHHTAAGLMATRIFTRLWRNR